jgi:hypothetical protein
MNNTQKEMLDEVYMYMFQQNVMLAFNFMPPKRQVVKKKKKTYEKL